MLLARSALCLTLLAVLTASVPAQAKTWKAGQTARYVVKPDGAPAYRVQVKVPAKTKLTVAGGRFSTLGGKKPDCAMGHPAAAWLEGESFALALRNPPPGAEQWVASGRGAGAVRWSQFAVPYAGITDQEFYAVHPKLKGDGAYDTEYYGFRIGSYCLGTAVAKKMARTVRLTPLG